MSDPTTPQGRGRHASPDFPSGVPASAWLTSMPGRATTPPSVGPSVGNEARRQAAAAGHGAADDGRSTGRLPR
ncbi:hypothetical protein E4P41_17200, partial [Geodermatophilus sp. DF01-2]